MALSYYCCMEYCPSCGHRIPKEADGCPFCGVVIVRGGQVASDGVSAAEKARAIAQQQSEQRKAKRRPFLR